jgi:sulfate adenylyltransferase subunit 2
LSELSLPAEAEASAEHSRLPPHLRRLEAESIGILREVAAEFRRPVLLYSIGKDSSVLLHLALKAFYRRSRPFRSCTSIRRGSSGT